MIALLTENVVEITPEHLLLLLLLSVVRYHTEFFIHRCASSQCVARESPVHCSCERAVGTGWGNRPLQPVETVRKGEDAASTLPQKVLVGPPLAWRLQPEMPFTLGARAPVEDAAWLVVLGWTSQGLPSGSKGTFVTAVHFTVVSQESHSRQASPFMAWHSLIGRSFQCGYFLFGWFLCTHPTYHPPPPVPTSTPFPPCAVGCNRFYS